MLMRDIGCLRPRRAQERPGEPRRAQLQKIHTNAIGKKDTIKNIFNICSKIGSYITYPWFSMINDSKVGSTHQHINEKIS